MSIETYANGLGGPGQPTEADITRFTDNLRESILRELRAGRDVRIALKCDHELLHDNFGMLVDYLSLRVCPKRPRLATWRRSTVSCTCSRRTGG